MFGKKDPMKEFEQLRTALKPAERFAVHTEKAEKDDGKAEENVNVHSSTPRADRATGAPPGDTAHVPSLDDRSSVVSVGSIWQGNLKIDGSVRIEGQVTGEIDARETVFVAETARIDAKVRAAYVVIAGEVEGEIQCTERIEIMPTGRVKAELTTKSLTVFEGAFIEGQIHMTRPEGAVLPLPSLTASGEKRLAVVAEKSASSLASERQPSAVVSTS